MGRHIWGYELTDLLAVVCKARSERVSYRIQSETGEPPSAAQEHTHPERFETASVALVSAFGFQWLRSKVSGGAAEYTVKRYHPAHPHSVGCTP